MQNFRQRLKKYPDILNFLRFYIIRCIETEDIERACQLLTNIGFIEEKVGRLQGENGVNSLIDDYQRTIEKITENTTRRLLTSISNAIQVSAATLMTEPSQAFPQLYSRLFSTDIADLHAMLTTYTPSSPWLRILSKEMVLSGAFLRTLIPFPPTTVNEYPVPPTTVNEHLESSLDCVISTDGKWALFAPGDDTLFLWNLQTGLRESVLRGHIGRVTACSLSSDASLALSASEDTTLRLWDLRDPTNVVCLRTFKGHTDQITDCTLSRNGKLCVSASRDQTVRVWDTSASDNNHVILTGHEDTVTCCALSADSTLILSGSFDNTLRLWKVQTQECVATIQDDGGITHCALSPDGRFAFSTWLAYQIDFDARDPETGDTPLQLFYNPGEKDEDEIRSDMKDHFFDDMISILSKVGITEVMDEQNKLRVWDLSSGQCVRKLEGHQTAIDDFDLSGDGKRLITCASDGTIKIWDAETGQSLTTLQEFSLWIRGCTIDQTGCRALSVSYNGDLHFWDVPSAIELLGKEGGKRSIDAVLQCAYDQIGNCALSVAGRVIQLWNAHTHEPIVRFTPELDLSSTINVNLDSRRAIITPPFLVSSEEETKDLTVKDLQTNQVIATLSGHAQKPRESILNRSGTMALSFSRDKTLWAWDIEKRECISVMQGHDGNIQCCALSADGSKALSGSEDTTLRLWETKTGVCLRILRGHTANVKECIFSEDGRRGLSLGDDNTICVWDIAGGALLQQIKPDAELADSIALSCDGRLAAYVLSGRTLHIADVATSRKVTSFTFDSEVKSIALSPDHVSIMVGDVSGRVHFLRLELDCAPLPA